MLGGRRQCHRVKPTNRLAAWDRGRRHAGALPRVPRLAALRRRTSCRWKLRRGGPHASAASLSLGTSRSRSRPSSREGPVQQHAGAGKDVTGVASGPGPSPKGGPRRAHLGDRSPTARHFVNRRQARQKGMIVLFHVTPADTPLVRPCRCRASFVDMLRRLVGPRRARTATNDASEEETRPEREVVPPTRILDGFGAFGPPTRGPTRPVPVGLCDPDAHSGSSAGLLRFRRRDSWAVNTLAPADQGSPPSTTCRCMPGSRPIRSAEAARNLRRAGAGLAALGLLAARTRWWCFLLAGGNRTKFCGGRPRRVPPLRCCWLRC